MVVFNKKKPSKKTTALAKANPTSELVPANAQKIVAAGLGELAQYFSGKFEVANEKVVGAFEALKSIESTTNDILKVAKQHMQTLVKVAGTPVPETKGTIRSAELGYEIRPTRTGYDSKKVEARFRAKSVDVNKYMDPVVTYIISDAKLLAAAADGVLTKDELEACRYDASYSVVKSKAGASED